MRTDDHPSFPDTATRGDLAHRFTAALAARDAAALRSLFGAAVDFRALTPGRVWEARSPAAVVDEVILGAWFEPSDVIERIESAETSQVATRTRLGYRLRVRNARGVFRCEQQAYLELADGKITWMRVLCSGFLPA